MKVIFILTTMCLLFVSCHSSTENKLIIKNGANERTDGNLIENDLIMANMNDSIVTKEFETFDFETYEKRPPADPKIGNYRYSKYVLKQPNSIAICMDEAGEYEGGGFYVDTYYPDSHFFLSKVFYPNGKIKRKGLMYIKGFNKGIWYHFNKDGKLIKEINEDSPYKFTFEDILRFCVENGISVEKGYECYERDWFGSIFITAIRRSCFEDSCQWEIEWKKPNPEHPGWTIGIIEERIILDGITGTVVSTKQLPCDYVN